MLSLYLQYFAHVIHRSECIVPYECAWWRQSNLTSFILV